MSRTAASRRGVGPARPSLVIAAARTSAPRAARAEPRRHRSGRVRRACTTIVVVAAIACTVGAGMLLRRANAEVAELFGHPLVAVAGGSMTPTFHAGDLVVDRPVGAATAARLHAGQVVTFERPGSGGTVLVTHRIDEVLHRGGANRQVRYRTKGDAAKAPDPWVVAPSQIVGTYAWDLPDGGYLLRALEGPWPLVAALLVATTWILRGASRRRRRAAARARRAAARAAAR